MKKLIAILSSSIAALFALFGQSNNSSSLSSSLSGFVENAKAVVSQFVQNGKDAIDSVNK